MLPFELCQLCRYLTLDGAAVDHLKNRAQNVQHYRCFLIVTVSSLFLINTLNILRVLAYELNTEFCHYFNATKWMIKLGHLLSILMSGHCSFHLSQSKLALKSKVFQVNLETPVK